MTVPDLAIKNLQKMLEKEPILRDILDPALPRTRNARFTPELDVIETKQGWTILLDVPGVAKGSLDVRLEGSQLVISGTRDAGRPEGKIRRSERASGDFEREFLLPTRSDPTRVNAQLKDGVLTVLVPRVNPTDHRIEITTDGDSTS
jgi:HSP20 family protein